MKTNPPRSSFSAPGAPSRRLTLALFGATLLAACETQPDRYLGGLLEEQSGGPPAAAPATATEPFGVPPSDFAGRWTGAAQNPLALEGDGDVYAFASGATQIVLELETTEEVGGSLVLGSITFGEPGPVPPIDPSIGYPSDAGYERLGYYERTHTSASGYPGPLPPYEGFTYHGGDYAYLSESHFFAFVPGAPELADGMLRFGFDTEEVVAPWCELQRPLPNGSGGFNCVKGDSWADDENGQCSVGFSSLSPEQEAAVLAAGVSVEYETVDCGKMFLCTNNRCTCNETSCYGYGLTRSAAELLLRRDGDNLVGVFSNVAFINPRGLPTPLGPVYFTRTP